MKASFCRSCGATVPDGQRFCSMCYGDAAYGTDGYYEAYLRRQEEEAQQQDRLIEEARDE